MLSSWDVRDERGASYRSPRVSERVFLHGISAEAYGLGEHRRAQLAAPRVRHRGGGLTITSDSAGYSGLSADAHTEWLVGPGDDPFLTQSLQVHTVDLGPGGSNNGHGHQNEALYYVLDGRGYEIHDDARYDWEGGDAVVVHADSVHRHFNSDPDKPSHGVIFKAKALWMYLGLWQQGRSADFSAAGFGPRTDWSRLWTLGVGAKRKVVKHGSTRWQDTRDGRVRVITSAAQTDVRIATVDLVELEIPVGGRSAKHWHMADEVLYVESGRGDTLQWEVAAEIAERYYARIANEPGCWEFGPTDTIYVPQNTVHQHVNTGDEPLRMLSAQNRIFKVLGYDAVVYPDA